MKGVDDNRFAYLKNGKNAPSWYHLTITSSSMGFPKKPPTSAPTNGNPASPIDSNMGTDTSRYSHPALLSPVHIGPKRCDPAKNARERTNGRSSYFPRFKSALAVAWWRANPYKLCTCRWLIDVVPS